MQPSPAAGAGEEELPCRGAGSAAGRPPAARAPSRVAGAPAAGPGRGPASRVVRGLAGAGGVRGGGWVGWVGGWRPRLPAGDGGGEGSVGQGGDCCEQMVAASGAGSGRARFLRERQQAEGVCGAGFLPEPRIAVGKGAGGRCCSGGWRVLFELTEVVFACPGTGRCALRVCSGGGGLLLPAHPGAVSCSWCFVYH